jgi:3-phenylpropionate/trans-cinnamate dioxygenase ferredoxin subunit
MAWFKIAEEMNELAFGSNQIAVIEVKNKKICIGRYQEQLFGFALKCPHAGGYLSDGHIDALGNVVCPLHRYRYALKNGRNVSGEGYYLKNWPVEIRNDGVYLEMDEGSSFWDIFR